MSQLLRILVTGDKNFNNYFYAYPYLKELVPQRSVIVSCGERGTDTIAEVFANSEQFIYEAYPVDWDNYGKSAAHIRNKGVIKMSKYVIIFWDGKNTDTKALIDMAKKKFSKPTIIEYTQDDIIKPHPDRVVNIRNTKCDIYCGRSSVYGNPFFLSNWDQREFVILRYTDYLIKNPKLIEEVLKLEPSQILGCHCAPALCHCDVLAWLIDNAKDELKSLVIKIKRKIETDTLKLENPPQSVNNNTPTIDEFKTPSRLYSKYGLEVAEGWDQVIEDGWMKLLEIPNNKIIKKNLHLSKKTIDLLASKDENEVVSIMYHTNEITNIPVVLCKVAFANSPYKEGYWYVNIKDVKI